MNGPADWRVAALTCKLIRIALPRNLTPEPLNPKPDGGFKEHNDVPRGLLTKIPGEKSEQIVLVSSRVIRQDKA